MTEQQQPEHQEWVQKLHKINGILHQEPMATVANGCFWYLILLFIAPLLAFGNLFFTAYKVIAFYGWKKEILPKDHPDKTLAVVVTGCDSGFGKELVFSLVSKGFVVFPACLMKESFDHFKGESKIIPIQMDVTKDKDVEDALQVVQKWLQSEDDDKSKKRYLHALVNNAGIGIAGLSDWFKLSDFQFIMDVNFFGAIRCVKAFLPILKRQAADGSWRFGRVVNMVSTAGLFAGGIISAAYDSSKHALDAYTTNLRVELEPFGIKVVGLNPSLHKTPLAEGKAIAKGMKKVWDDMDPDHREEYGEDYFNAVAGIFENSTGKFSWDKKYVVEALDEAVVAQSPPSRMMVGLDAKYVIYPVSKLPTYFRVNFIRKIPAMMAK